MNRMQGKHTAANVTLFGGMAFMVCTNIHTHIYRHTLGDTHTVVYIENMQIHVCKHTCTHTKIHTHTHTHIHIYRHKHSYT